mmetsp:Transcript_16949/g.47315  ORF Transcript_16949/g.47315 Transcript_16949/m.47315 type:complete len:283 (+) Transcript_16949:274-1122(+)
MHLLGLLRCGNHAGANSPNRLIGNHHLGPVCHRALVCLHLRGQDIPQGSILALLEALPNAANHSQAIGNGVGSLLCNDFVGLATQPAALGMAKNDPRHLHVGQHLRADLASVGTARPGPAVLGSNGDRGPDGGHHFLQVDEWRGTNDLYVGWDAAGVEVLHQRGYHIDRAVALPVASNKELAVACHGHDVPGGSAMAGGPEGHWAAARDTLPEGGGGLHEGEGAACCECHYDPTTKFFKNYCLPAAKVPQLGKQRLARRSAGAYMAGMAGRGRRWCQRSCGS